MRFEHEIAIGRPPTEVFAYLTDPEKLSAWQTTTVGVERDRTGPLVVGERFAEVHKAFGHESRTTVEVVAFEEPGLFALHIASGSLPLHGRWELEPAAGGTRMRFVGHGEIRGLKRLLKPMLARQFRKYHERLKSLLEDGDPA
jgi:uncharacterized protein YndB with AHSA1/START domain